MRRVLKWLFLGVGALLIAAAVWLFNTDLGRFKPQIEHMLSEATGRDFAIEGELHIHLGRTIEISLEGLRMANPEWAGNPVMVGIDEAAASVKLSSLPRTPLVIETLNGRGLEINIEQRPAAARDESAAGKPGGFARFRKFMGRFIVRRGEVEGFRITFLGAGADEPLAMDIDRITQHSLPEGMLQIDFSGRAKDVAFQYRGQVGPFENLLDGGDVHYRGEGALGNTRFASEGFVDYLGAPRYPTFVVTMEGPDFSEFARSIGRASTFEEPFRIEAAARREGKSLGTSVAVDIGGLFIDLKGRSASISDYSSVDYRISARGPDLGQFTRLVRAGAWPEEPFSFEGALHRNGTQMDFEEIRLKVGETFFDLDGSLTHFPRVDKGRVELNIAGPDVAAFRELIGFRGVAEGQFSASLQLETGADGAQRLEVRAQTTLATSSASAVMGDGPNYAGTRVEFSASGRSAGELLGGFGVPGLPGQPFNLETVFEIHENGLSFEEGVLATIEDDRWEVTGFVGSEPLKKDTDIRIRVSGNDLSEFSHLAAADLPLPVQPYQLEGGVKVTATGFHFDGIHGQIGPNRMMFDGVITRDPSLAGTDFTFELSGPNLQTLVRDTERFHVAPRAFQASGRLRHQGGVVRLEEFRLNAHPFQVAADIEAKMPFDGSHARFQVAASGEDLDFLVPEHPKLQLKSQPWALRADGKVEAGQWTFEQAEIKIADASLALDGVIDQLPDFSATDFAFVLLAPTPGSLGVWNGDPLPRRSIDIRSHFSGTARQFLLDQLTAQMGATDFTGHLVADYSGRVPEIRFDAQSRMIDWKEWLAVTTDTEDDTKPPPADGRAIPDFRFPLEQMAKVNVAVNIDAQELRTRRQILRDVNIDARLWDGALVIDQVRGEGIDGYIEGTMALIPRGARNADFSLDIDVTGLKLDLRKKDGADPGELPLVTVEVDVAGHGPGLRQVASTLNGHVFADSTPGVIPNSVLAALDKGLVDQVFGAMLPKTEESKTTRLQCFAARLYVQDGLVKAKPGAALVTEKVQIISNGQINLENEKIDMTFQAFPTRPFRANVSEVLINPFVKISGTLGQPKLALDAPRALISTGVAVGTGGLSILAKGLWDRLRGSKDPCARFMEEGEKM